MQDEDTHNAVKKEGAMTEELNTQVRDSPESKSIDTSGNVHHSACFPTVETKRVTQFDCFILSNLSDRDRG